MISPDGVAFVVTNTPDFYAGHWVSCDVNFPENEAPLRSGQPVRARLMPEGVIVNDTFWSDEDYRDTFAKTGLTVVGAQRPLADADETGWLDESRMAPYVVYELSV